MAQILIVDDDAQLRQSFGKILEGEGYEVRAARDGPAALDLLDGFSPDIVVSDMGLPGMSGAELFGLLRERSPGLRIAFVSGFCEPAVVEALEAAHGAGNEAEVQRLAHSLKGTGGTLGATGLQALAAALESAIKNGEPAARQDEARAALVAAAEALARQLAELPGAAA